MQRIIKSPNSVVIAKGISYKVNGDNTVLQQILKTEQNSFCAYTETYLGRSDKAEIDHFNPTLKGTKGDHYLNWFLVKAKWNSEKSKKWTKFQPVLHPTSEDFNKRIVYQEGDYSVHSEDDLEAKHLIELLKLDDPDLADERKRYIRRKREEIALFEQSPQEFFNTLLQENISQIQFPRAIYEEFGIDIYSIRTS